MEFKKKKCKDFVVKPLYKCTYYKLSRFIFHLQMFTFNLTGMIIFYTSKASVHMHCLMLVAKSTQIRLHLDVTLLMQLCLCETLRFFTLSNPDGSTNACCVLVLWKSCAIWTFIKLIGYFLLRFFGSKKQKPFFFSQNILKPPD